MIHKTITVPDNKDLVFVGDLHGCINTILPHITDNMFLVCTGDLVDRGPHSLATLQYFYDNQDSCTTVIGNHDYDWILKHDNKIYYKPDLRNFLVNLPVFLTIFHRGIKYGVVHGGFPSSSFDSDKNPDWDVITSSFDQETLDSYWIQAYIWDRTALRDINLGIKVPSIKNVDYMINGHTYTEDPLVHGNRVFLDTGGVFKGGKFTFATLDTDWNFKFIYNED